MGEQRQSADAQLHGLDENLHTLGAAFLDRGGHGGEARVVARAVFPEKLVDGKQVLRIKAAAGEFSEGEPTAAAAIAVGKRMNSSNW